MTLCGRVGAEQSEPALAEHRATAPDLLAAQQPASVGAVFTAMGLRVVENILYYLVVTFSI